MEDWGYCAKCHTNAPTVSVTVGNFDRDSVIVEMELCWDCFNENFQKDGIESIYKLYDYQSDDDLDSDDEFDDTFEGN